MGRPHVFATGATVCALALTATACSSGADESGDGTGRKGGSVSVAVQQAWSGFNPHTPDQGNNAGLAISNAIYPSAFNVQPNQTVKLNSDLLVSATSVSTNPQTIEYKIKPSAVWSDGKPITGADFTYLWQHSNGKDKKLQVSSTIGYSQIKSVTSEGDGKTVRVVFDKPFADWKSLFDGLLPAHFMKTLGNDADAWNKGLAKKIPPSGGPFSIAENRPDQYIEFQRNPKWYGKPANPDKVTLRLIEDNQAVVQALASGEVDVASLEATRALIGQVKAVSGVKSTVVPTTSMNFLNFQHKDPVIKDVAVRRAIATVVQPEQVAKTVIGDGYEKLLTNNFIYSPASADYSDERPASFGTGDVAAAKKILESAGYRAGGDGIYAKNGTKLIFNYVVTPGDQIDQVTSVLFQDTFKKIGMKLEIKSVPVNKAFDVLMAGEYSTTFGGYPDSDFPVSWYSALYTCDGGYNLGRFCDPAVDTLYNEANTALDPKRQAEVVKQLNKKLWEDVANIPLWMRPLLVVTTERVSGVTTDIPTNWILHNATQWSVAR
ncbi:ABC transporter family substrate-binding protein [Streptomyces sp. NPDC051018]|uniref:ABC transporter family substrate-binding protein n=1 Tax=Streptomyces sp. NPDC051018 TaxID=3365639 RepID=UPI0037A76997